MKALSDVIKRARKSPFYKTRLRSPEFGDAPITTKEDLRSGYPFGFLAVPKEHVATYHESSGSEGKPIASCFTESDWNDIATRFNRNALALSPRDTFFIKTPYSMVTTAHQAHLAARLAGAMVVPGDNRTSNMPYSRVVQLLREVGITTAWSLPTELFLWYLAATRRNPKSPNPPVYPNLRAFCVAGEALAPSQKRHLEKLWGVPVYEDYGSTETGSLGGECPARRLHLWADRIHFEVLRGGKLHGSGKGRLVVTPLYREAMPLVRYCLDDVVAISHEPCPCGSTLPHVTVFGRASGEINVGRKKLFPLQIQEAVFKHGAELGITLWKGLVRRNSIEITYLGKEGKLGQALQEELQIKVQARRAPLREFMDPRLLTQTMAFQKPRFLFTKKDSGSAYQYF